NTSRTFLAATSGVTAPGQTTYSISSSESSAKPRRNVARPQAKTSLCCSSHAAESVNRDGPDFHRCSRRGDRASGWASPVIGTRHCLPRGTVLSLALGFYRPVFRSRGGLLPCRYRLEPHRAARPG